MYWVFNTFGVHHLFTVCRSLEFHVFACEMRGLFYTGLELGFKLIRIL